MNICKKCPNIKTSKAEVIESDRCFLSVDQVKKYCTEAKEKLRGVRGGVKRVAVKKGRRFFVIKGRTI